MIVPTLQCPTPNSTKHIGARVNNKHVVGRGGGSNIWYCPGDDWQDRDWNRRGQGWFRHWIRDRSGGHGWHLLTQARAPGDQRLVIQDYPVVTLLSPTHSPSPKLYKISTTCKNKYILDTYFKHMIGLHSVWFHLTIDTETAQPSQIRSWNGDFNSNATFQLYLSFACLWFYFFAFYI